MRTFASGAIRDTDENKLDYEGFLNPLVLRAFAEYMHKHRQMPDGSLRGSDNWQKGIPREQLMKSLLRHVMSVWEEHRHYGSLTKDDLCGVLFNTQGLLLDLIKEEYEIDEEAVDDGDCCNCHDCLYWNQREREDRS